MNSWSFFLQSHRPIFYLKRQKKCIGLSSLKFWGPDNTVYWANPCLTGTSSHRQVLDFWGRLSESIFLRVPTEEAIRMFIKIGFWTSSSSRERWRADSLSRLERTTSYLTQTLCCSSCSTDGLGFWLSPCSGSSKRGEWHKKEQASHPHARLKVGRNAWGAAVCLATEPSPHFATIAEEALQGVSEWILGDEDLDF